MEKIQQALERAKLQREGKTNRSHIRNYRDADVQSIEYTKTKVFETSEVLQRENRILNAMDHSEYVDAFKILSTQVVQRMEENQWQTLAITSVGSREGKTTTAINLGLSIAKEIEYTVFLVDCNLRKPDLHNYFGVKSEQGLGDYLKNDVDLESLLIRPANVDHFVILPGGKPLMQSTELLGSPKMCSLVEELKYRYPKRIVIFDMPPVLGTADTVSFAPCVDCVLITVEDDVTKESDLKRAVDLMSVTNVLGTVLNKAKYL